MRFRRSRRRNLILLSSRAAPPPGVRQAAQLVRRRRSRVLRTGALLTVIGVMRLAQIARSRWRISLGLLGVLLEVLGHCAFTGPARGAAGLLGLAFVLVALLKNADPASRDTVALPQAAWHGRG